MEKNNVKRLPWGNTEIQIVQNTKIQTLAEKLVTIAIVTTAASRQAGARAGTRSTCASEKYRKKVALGNTEYVKYKKLLLQKQFASAP